MVTKRSIIVSWLLLMSLAFTLPASSSTTDAGTIITDQAQIGEILSFNVTGTDTVTNGIGGRYDLVQFGDGLVSGVWEDVPEYPISAYGEKGAISSIHGEEYIYFLLRQDPADLWISLQWDSDGTANPESDPSIDQMEDGDDMWVLGLTEGGTLGDVTAGFPEVTQDNQNDLYWERILVNDTEGNLDHVAWEIKRAKDTGDSAGADVVFTDQQNVTVRFASHDNHESGNVMGKFALASDGIGGNVTITPPDNSGSGESSGFIGTHVAIGLAIGIGTYIAIFVPTFMILNKKEEIES